MIRSIKISGYRGFESFTIEGLGRINLLVGRNNSGKTSILDAIYLLSAQGDPGALWRIMSRRGENILTETTPGQPQQQELDVCHLFHGHGFRLGATAKIATTNETPGRSLTLTIGEAKQKGNEALFAHLPPDPDGLATGRLGLLLEGTPPPVSSVLPLSVRGGMAPETIQLVTRLAANPRKPKITLPQYITTDFLSWPEMVNMWNSISLGPNQGRVIKALQVLEAGLEGIAPSPSPQAYLPGATRSGLKVKLKDLPEPIPIGSLGEGIWRMLGLAIVISKATGTLLLVDEIDTGLHHSVMEEMWNMLNETAMQFDVQVFATTHSYDCVNSLAYICREASETSEISIQRIETGKSEAIAFNEQQVRIAAERHIEIR